MKKNVVLSLFILILGIQPSVARNYTLETGSVNVPKYIQNSSSNVTDFSSAFYQGFSNGISGNSERAALIAASPRGSSGYDPYLIEINGIKYMLIKDNNDGIFNEEDILGIKDTQKNVFASLKPLDTDRNLKLTGKELENSGVRLVKINENGKLDYKNKENDFKNSNIEFIYLSELRKAYKNDGTTGQFGQYDVVIKNNKGEKTLVTGLVTFESKNQVEKYF